MKKLIISSLCVLVLAGCKTEIEKDVSLNKLFTQPVQEETALLNVEIFSCNNREDSRLESDDLIKIKSKIPAVFKNAKYKECYSKRSNSFAVFEIPVALGKQDDFQTKYDIAIMSNDKLGVIIESSGELSKNIRNFLKSEFIPRFDFNITLNVVNDTDKEHHFNLYSAYIDDSPVSVAPIDLKKGDKVKIRLSNASADALWRYEGSSGSVILGPQVKLF
ncbi:hypothetical protein [Gallibacterium anatis]|uniref:DUF7424 domain-containing protein n=1 Tax=Gallibacterium anatis TaxID=750 RepID=A0A1A7P628_9PAST|nr:hypothetical protein [Gallibacterium anatis]OBW97176.1 hypothetical protein QV02_01650 [Gallibacterium anatis]OBW99300.1 hypothetical protein QV03_03735 [Gallibacterium anatis]